MPPPSRPQGELQLLCMQLDRHISTHIRESPQAMHRTKLKDLATQTYIRWQDLLAHCQPQVVSPNLLVLGGKGSSQSAGLGRSAAPPPPLQLLDSKGKGGAAKPDAGWGCLRGPREGVQWGTGRPVYEQMQRNAALKHQAIRNRHERPGRGTQGNSCPPPVHLSPDLSWLLAVFRAFPRLLWFCFCFVGWF